MQKALSGLVLTKSDDEYLSQIGNLESKAYLAPVADLREQAKASMKYRPDGLGLPFGGTSMMRFMPGRWTLWSGVTHSGKTQFVRFLMAHAMKERERVLFASLEEEPVEVVEEFASLMCATRDLNEKRLDAAIDWMDERLLIFNHSGFIEPDVIVGAAIYAAENLGVTQVVIDSMMMLSLRKDDFEGQREFGMLLRRVTRQYNIHIHLIAHPRKSGSSQDQMDLNDIQGAQELAALADNIITLGRVPKSLQKRSDWGIVNEWTGTVLRAWKQRGHWNKVGIMELAYLADTRQWANGPNQGPRRFMMDELYPELGIDLMGQNNSYDDGQWASGLL